MTGFTSHGPHPPSPHRYRKRHGRKQSDPRFRTHPAARNVANRIVSRTLAYGLLTLLLGGCYAAVALGLGQLLGRDSTLAVALATLAVSVAFQPARRRIQRSVDRRFNRRRYDAARTIQAFTSRLRQELDLDALTAELLVVAEQTMQPTTVSLWLRPQRHR